MDITGCNLVYKKVSVIQLTPNNTCCSTHAYNKNINILLLNHCVMSINFLTLTFRLTSLQSIIKLRVTTFKFIHFARYIESGTVITIELKLAHPLVQQTNYLKLTHPTPTGQGMPF